MDEIEGNLKVVMQRVAEAIEKALEEDNMGFALLVFDFGPGGRMNFISNANRRDMVKAMKELIENLEKAG